jgi:hypothetical protein
MRMSCRGFVQAESYAILDPLRHDRISRAARLHSPEYVRFPETFTSRGLRDSDAGSPYLGGRGERPWATKRYRVSYLP